MDSSNQYHESRWTADEKTQARIRVIARRSGRTLKEREFFFDNLLV